jgi:hypothetical protein
MARLKFPTGRRHRWRQLSRNGHSSMLVDEHADDGKLEHVLFPSAASFASRRESA